MFFKPVKKIFNPRDSGLIFSISLLTISFVGIFISALFSELTTLTEDARFFISTTLTQLTLFVTCIIYCKHTNTALPTALGIKAPLNAKHTLFSALTGLTLSLALIVPLIYFIKLLELMGYTSTVNIQIKTPINLIISVVLLCAVPAVCEEILFRGIMLQGLRKFGDAFAVSVSAVLFMLFHTNPTQTLYPLLSGLVLGFVLIKTGNIVYPMLIHFFNNLISVVTEYISFNTDIHIWTDLEFTPLNIIFTAVSAVIVAVCAVYFFKQKSVKANNTNPCVLFCNIFSNGKAFLKAYNAYLEKQNNTEQADKSDKKTIEYLACENARLLFEKGFIFDTVKNVFINTNDSECGILTPEYFTDVSHLPLFNPYASTKKSFLKYALVGLLLSVALWLFTFFY